MTRPYPVVLVHGGGFQGTEWLDTPDGRPGWAQRLVEAGYATVVVDRPGHGRSPLHTDIIGPMGPPFSYEGGRQIYCPARPGGPAHAMAVRARRRRRDGPVHRRLRPAAGRPRRLGGHGRRPPRPAARPDRAGDPAHPLGVRPERLARGRPPAGAGPRHRQRRADGAALRRYPQHRPAALGSDRRAAHVRPAARLARGGAWRRPGGAAPAQPGRACRSPW